MSGHLTEEPDLSFTVEVEVDKCEKDGDNLTFPIAGGYLKTGKGFTPQLECNIITGRDRATLKDRQLHLNAGATAQMKGDPNSDDEQKIEVQWGGVVEMRENENKILKGNFQGKTDFGNPKITSWKLIADGEKFAKLGKGNFEGVGRFDVKDGKVNLEYHVYQLGSGDVV